MIAAVTYKTPTTIKKSQSEIKKRINNIVPIRMCQSKVYFFL